MAETESYLMLEFLRWVAGRRRTYDEAMEAWQSHCPRHTVWEDAIVEGFIRLAGDSSDPEVVLTEKARAVLRNRLD